MRLAQRGCSPYIHSDYLRRLFIGGDNRRWYHKPICIRVVQGSRAHQSSTSKHPFPSLLNTFHRSNNGNNNRHSSTLSYRTPTPIIRRGNTHKPNSANNEKTNTRHENPRREDDDTPSKSRGVKINTILITLPIIIVLIQSLGQIMTVTGPSMAPTLSPEYTAIRKRDRVWVSSLKSIWPAWISIRVGPSSAVGEAIDQDERDGDGDGEDGGGVGQEKVISRGDVVAFWYVTFFPLLCLVYTPSFSFCSFFSSSQTIPLSIPLSIYTCISLSIDISINSCMTASMVQNSSSFPIDSNIEHSGYDWNSFDNSIPQSHPTGKTSLNPQSPHFPPPL